MSLSPSSLSQLLASDTHEASWAGGRGLYGPLGVWLIVHYDAIRDARGRLIRRRWAFITGLAAQDGVRREDGEPYDVEAVRRAWGRISRTMASGEKAEARPSRSTGATSAPAARSAGAKFPAVKAIDTSLATGTVQDLLRVRQFGEQR